MFRFFSFFLPCGSDVDVDDKKRAASGTAQLSELSELSERNGGGKKQASDVTTHKYEGECEGREGNEDKTRRLFGHKSNTK